MGQHQHLQDTNQMLPPSRPLPNFPDTNHIGHTAVRGQSSSPPRNRTTNQNLPHMSHSHVTTPPRAKPGKSFPAGMPAGSQSDASIEPNDKMSLQGFSPIYGEFSRGAGWDGARAVPIRPPQQGEDPYQQGDQQPTVRSSE